MKILLLIFTLCLISDGGTSKEVTGYSGGGVLIKCKYHPEYSQNIKYFCKGSWVTCSDQIKTGNKNKSVTSGRFSLFDDTKSEFRVMIRDLTVDDAGTYHCGIHHSAKVNYNSVKLQVKEGSSGSREVSAYAGGGIKIKCRSEDEYKDKLKSFCNMETHECTTTSDLSSEWTHDGRFSIYTRKSSGFFSVMIRDVKMEDTGTYSCAVAVSDEFEIYTVVKLNVTEDLSYEKFINKTVDVGGDLYISCKYPQSLRNATKFLCRRRHTADCSTKPSVHERKVKVGKFSLYDDRTEEMFSVRIRNVTETDSGEFWCGAEAAWTSDHGYKLYFTQIKLIVTETPLNPTHASVPSSSSSSSSTLAPEGLKLNVLDTVLINVMIAILVGGTCLCLTILIKHMIKGRKASSDKNSVPNSGNSHEVNDTRGILTPDAGTSADGSIPHDLLTSPSDPPSQAIYANTMSPTPQDHSASLVSKSTNFSDSASATVEQTAENLNYATVRFHRDDAGDKIRLEKEEEPCEYSTVRRD